MATIIRRNEEMAEVWESIVRITHSLNLPMRCEMPLVDAAYGRRITRPSYINEASLTDAKEVTEFIASRDLRRLSDVGMLLPHGEKRGRFYTGSPEIRKLRDNVRNRIPVPDPYELIRATAHQSRQPAIPGLVSAK